MSLTPLQHTALSWGSAIIETARQHDILVRVQDIVRGPQVLTYGIELRRPADLAAFLKLDEVLALRLGVLSARTARSLGRVHVEVALPDRWHVPLHLASLAPGRGLSLPLGKTTANRQIALDLADDRTPHALVAGTTGSGKTVLLRTIISQIARQNPVDDVRLLLVDGKARGLAGFARLPHLLHPLVTDPGEAAQLLAWCVQEMESRKAGPWNARLVLVVDEVAEIIAATGGKDDSAAEHLRRLASMGRELGVHIILATQYPTNDVLGGALARANLPARLVGRVVHSQASALAAGVAGMKANQLLGRGDFLLVADGAERFQVAMADDDDLLTLPRSYQEPTSLPLLDEPPAVAGAAGLADPLTPAQVAWVMAQADGAVPPGIGRIKSALGVGSLKAGRLQSYARDVLAELAAQGRTLAHIEPDHAGEFSPSAPSASSAVPCHMEPDHAG